MRNNRRNNNVHTFLFILLGIALAVLASAATFRRGRPARFSNGAATPVMGAVSSAKTRFDDSSKIRFARGGYYE
jgi:hypothetical protein